MERQLLPNFACWCHPVSVKGICHCSISVEGAWDWHWVLRVAWLPDLSSQKPPIYLLLFAVDVCKVCHELLPKVCIHQHTASGMQCNTWSIKVLHVSKSPTSLKRGNLCLVSGLDFSCLTISKCIMLSLATYQVTVVLGNVSRSI